MVNNIFIFEGITGSGKSTQIRLLKDKFKDLNLQVLDRSSPVIGAMKEMRVLISNAGSPLVTQGLSYILENVAKVETVKEYKGITIIDRYVLSNVAYLVAKSIETGHCIDRDAVRKTAFFPFGFDLLKNKSIIYLDCDPKEAEYRTNTRGSKEIFDFDLHSSARKIYREELDKLVIPHYEFDTTFRKLEDINSEIEQIIRGTIL